MKGTHTLHHHAIKRGFLHNIPTGVQLLLISIASYGANFFLNSILANHMSSENYGEFNVILQVSMLLSTLGLLGLDSNFIQFGSRYKKDGLHAHTHGLLRWTNTQIKKSSVVILVISALLCLGLLTHNHIYSTYEPMYFSFFVVPFYAYMTLQMSYLQAYGLDTQALTPTYVIYPIVFIAFFSIGFGHYGQMDIYHTIFVMGLSYLVTVVIAYWLSRTVFKQEVFPHQPNNDHRSRWYTDSKKFWSSELMLIIVTTYEVLLLKLFFNTTLIARVMVVNTTGALIWTIQGILSKHLVSYVAPALEGNTESLHLLKQECKKYNKSILLCGVLLCVLFFILGEHILNIFGKEYMDLVNVLRFYIVSATLGCYLQGACTILSLSEKQSMYKAVLVIELVLGTVGIIVFASFFGALGVVMGCYLALIVQGLVAAWYIKRTYQLNCLAI